MLSWFSCKKYAQLASKKLDAPIVWSEKPGYWFHHFLCMSCRRFEAHIDVLEKTVRSLGEKDLERIEQEESPSEGLSSEAKQRMENALRGLS